MNEATATTADPEAQALIRLYASYSAKWLVVRRTKPLTHPRLRELTRLLAMVVNELRTEHGIEIED